MTTHASKYTASAHPNRSVITFSLCRNLYLGTRPGDGAPFLETRFAGIGPDVPGGHFRCLVASPPFLGIFSMTMRLQLGGVPTVPSGHFGGSFTFSSFLGASPYLLGGRAAVVLGTSR